MRTNKKNNNDLKRINDGYNHWVLQRISAILIIPLIFWFLYSILGLMLKTYNESIEWVINPLNATLLIILLIGIFYHSGMGLQVVIEDYISNMKYRMVVLNISKIVLLSLAIISIISVLKIILY